MSGLQGRSYARAYAERCARAEQEKQRSGRVGNKGTWVQRFLQRRPGAGSPGRGGAMTPGHGPVRAVLSASKARQLHGHVRYVLGLYTPAREFR